MLHPIKLSTPPWAPSRLITLGAMAAVAGLLVLSACQDPAGHTGGRVGTTDTTDPEARSRKVLPAALIEFSDQAPRELVAKLMEIPAIRDAITPVTVILGDMNNQTQIVSTNDFEMMARRMRNNLINSDFARGKLSFVQDRSRVEALASREQVVTETGTTAAPPAYQAGSTYALIGDFYRVRRGDMNQYYMEFQLVSFATNQIVFSDRFDVKQLRQ